MINALRAADGKLLLSAMIYGDEGADFSDIEAFDLLLGAHPQAHGVPGLGHALSQVRIVGEDRVARGTASRSDDPAVGTDPRAGAETLQSG